MAAPYFAPLPGPTASKAVTRTAERLGLSQVELASVLGASKATVSRLVAGRYQLSDSRRKEWELGLLLIRLYRSLAAVVGDGEAARTWLRGPNRAFGRPPIEEIVTAEGLVRVVQYLDAARGRL